MATATIESPRQACSGFQDALRSSFPGTQRELLLLDSVEVELEKLGFKKDTTIACVGTCRDEICSDLGNELERRYGQVFNMRGLAGFLFCGKTGFGAAHAHSPEVNGRDHYLYVVAPHIGISEDGAIGECSRLGREKPSHACGALCAMQGIIKAGNVDTSLNMDDVEMSLIKQLVMAEVKDGAAPDLVELTKLSSKLIVRQLETAIAATVKTDKADYAVISGIQIHGPGIGKNYFQPDPENCYAVVDGKRTQLNVTD